LALEWTETATAPEHMDTAHTCVINIHSRRKSHTSKM